jgi:hypothetical protein
LWLKKLNLWPVSELREPDSMTMAGKPYLYESIIMAEKPYKKMHLNGLRIEAPELLGVPWVAFILSCLLVPEAICSSEDHLHDDVWSKPW